MTALSIFDAILLISTAFLFAWIFNKIFSIELPSTHTTQIDGLRGYVAFFVFLHHAYIWRIYITTGEWVPPTSLIYGHFGRTSVAIFFMITGHLFFSKLLNASKTPINWINLYTSRILRIMPLYMLCIGLVLVIVFTLSKFHLYEPLPTLITKILIWISALSLPNINGFANTFQIVAGVPWTLGYEWFFYMTLPLIGLFLFRTKTPFPILIATTLIAICICILLKPSVFFIMCFVTGLISANLSKNSYVTSFAKRKLISVFLICMLLLLMQFDPQNYALPFIIVSIIFIFIVCGNTLFGTLNNKVARIMGQISYSIYLLHGIILFCLLYTIRHIQISHFEYVKTMVIATFILLLVSFITYKYIELPGITMTKRISIFVDRKYRMIFYKTKRDS